MRHDLKRDMEADLLGVLSCWEGGWRTMVCSTFKSQSSSLLPVLCSMDPGSTHCPVFHLPLLPRSTLCSPGGERAPGGPLCPQEGGRGDAVPLCHAHYLRREQPRNTQGDLGKQEVRAGRLVQPLPPGSSSCGSCTYFLLVSVAGEINTVLDSVYPLHVTSCPPPS